MKIIALGNKNAGDDGAALLAASRLSAKAQKGEMTGQPCTSGEPTILYAGRVGTGLLDLLDSAEPVILLDVITGTGRPGNIVRQSFDELINNVAVGKQVSSHGFGPAEVLKLGHALGRSLPEGCFIGIEGEQFETGGALSISVNAAMGAFVDAVQEAMEEYSRD